MTSFLMTTIAAASSGEVVLTALVFLLSLGLTAAVVLAIASKVFYVKEDPRIEAIENVLPGANCGGCGYPGCSGCAAAMVAGKAPPNACVAGGNDVALAVAPILGLAAELKEPEVAWHDCFGGTRAERKFNYEGALDCRAAVQLYGGDTVCPIGCLGLGSCVKACQFDAIKMGPNGYPVVNAEKCKACGKCAEACPRGVITVVSASARILHLNRKDDCLAPCRQRCPAQINIPQYIEHIKNGEFEKAILTLKERNPLILTCGRICPHPCEDECRRQLEDDPVGINFLKRYVADWEMEQPKRVQIPLAPETGKRVAVVGGGPAGISAAFFLRRLGHKPTIFESMPKLGGMLRYGIPEYRLPKAILDWEIQGILDMGIDAKLEKRFGRDFTIKSLKEEGYDAVLLAMGAWLNSKMRVEGEDADGVLGGTEFLNAVGLGEPQNLGDKVVVVGGGNTAIDACRTSLRLGVKEVILMYRRTRKEMPANEVEIVASEHEKIKFMFLAAPTRVITDENGKMTHLEYTKMELGEPDASGRRRPVPIEGSEEQIKVDTIISAIGQFPDTSFNEKESEEEKVELTRWNTIVADENTLQTKVPYVFTAGDIFTGPDLVVTAIGGGRRAARSIHYYMTEGEIPVPDNIQKKMLPESMYETIEGVNKKGRVTMPELEVEDRVDNMKEVDKRISREDAKHECERCMRCGTYCYTSDEAAYVSK